MISGTGTCYVFYGASQAHGRYGPSFSTANAKPETLPQEVENETPAPKIVISRIIAHFVASDQSPLDRVQWYGYGSDYNTWKQIYQPTMRHVLLDHCARNVLMPLAPSQFLQQAQVERHCASGRALCDLRHSFSWLNRDYPFGSKYQQTIFSQFSAHTNTFDIII